MPIYRKLYELCGENYSNNIKKSNKTIIKDIKEEFVGFSHDTFKSYHNAFRRLFVITDIDAWNPNIRSASAMRSGVKREFIDPSIAVATLNINPELLLFDLNTFGFIFETLCICDLSVYTYEYGDQISYSKDKYGLEADYVIHLENGDYT